MTTMVLFAAWSQYFFGSVLFFTSLFLILLVLVQRGRGGGLAGAFGGMGGQSAFGTKAGDLFTRITIGVATFWILLCILSIATLNREASIFDSAGGVPGGGFESLGGDEGLVAPTQEVPGAGGALLPAEQSPLPGESTPASPLGTDPGPEPEPEE